MLAFDIILAKSVCNLAAKMATLRCKVALSGQP